MTKNKNPKYNKKLAVAIVIGMIVLVFASCLTGSLIAKYISEKREQAELISTSFHISSNYLEKKTAMNPDPKQYTVTDWGYNEDYQISFKLYNYEKENVALISEKDIHYNIKAEGWSVTVKDQSGNTVLPSGGLYTMSTDGETLNEYTVYLKRKLETTTIATVVVTTEDPFTTSLYAVFHLGGMFDYDLTLNDCDHYVKVILDTNNYHGNIKVTWNDDFSPDNTQPLMKDWINVNTATFSVNEQTTYKLIFFKNSTNADPTSGIVIESED